LDKELCHPEALSSYSPAKATHAAAAGLPAGVKLEVTAAAAAAEGAVAGAAVNPTGSSSSSNAARAARQGPRRIGVKKSVTWDAGSFAGSAAGSSSSIATTQQAALTATVALKFAQGLQDGASPRQQAVLCAGGGGGEAQEVGCSRSLVYSQSNQGMPRRAFSMRRSNSIGESLSDAEVALLSNDSASSVLQQQQQQQLLGQQNPPHIGHCAALATVEESKSLRLMQLPAGSAAAAAGGARQLWHSQSASRATQPAAAAAAAGYVNGHGSLHALPDGVLNTEDAWETEDSLAVPPLLQAGQLFEQQQQQHDGSRSIRGFADVLSRAISSAAAAAYQPGSSSCHTSWQGGTHDAGACNSSTSWQPPALHISRSRSVVSPLNFKQQLQQFSHAGTPYGMSAASDCCTDHPGSSSGHWGNLQDWLASHSSTAAAAAGASLHSPSLLTSQQSTGAMGHSEMACAPLRVPFRASSSFAKQSSPGAAMLVPTEPANIFEASIAARPNFEARELPPGSYWYQVVNALILCVLLAGTVIELVTGKNPL
jgi:hypothetical protein